MSIEDGDHGADDDAIVVTEDEAPAAAPAGVVDGTAAPWARAKLIALASGRGGTGRSLLAANFAVYLAQAGKKVIAIDADPAGGPLHQMFGANRPTRGFGDLMRGKATRLAELVVDTPIAGVGMIAGDGSAFGAARPRMTAKVTLAAIAALDVDYVVLDLGPPDSTLTVDLWLAADIPILVTIPDPASIEATYRFAKSAFIRRLRTTRGLDRMVPNPSGPPPGALEIYRSIKEAGGPADRLVQEIRRYRPTFIMNQTRTLPDQKLGGFMATAARRRLGHSLEYLGHVESDETVWLAARRRRSLIAEYPDGKASKNIERLGRRLLSLDGERERERPVTGPMRTEEEQTYYEVLETEPGVSDEEIRRAHRTVKDNYASGSMVIAGLYDDIELAALHARINAAHDTLFMPDRRRLYDLALPEADLARAVRAAAQVVRPAPTVGGVAGPEDRPETPDPVIDSTAEITGALLKKVREIRGLELNDIAQRTKISERYLRALEEEQFTDMPAAVYVRGYVTEYARALRLNPQRAAESYLARYRAKLPKAAPTPSTSG
jgi:flagellar biosynthesis protein FlhG